MNSHQFLEKKKLEYECLLKPYSGQKIIYNPTNYLLYVDLNGNLLSNYKF